ncbi:hypothetical protein NUACC21_25220 [Scytonema sp. NUACC21]
MMFGTNQPESTNALWRHQLNRFVKEHQQELAALSWGLWLENGNSQGIIGIDLQPAPHFVYCPKEALEKLNNNVENRLQEVLGIEEHHNPEVEVFMIGIARDQIKLIYFQPETPPPTCYEHVGKDVNTLLDELEAGLSKVIEV